MLKTLSDQLKNENRFRERRSAPTTLGSSQAFQVQKWTRIQDPRHSGHCIRHTQATSTPHRRKSWRCMEAPPIDSSSI